MTLSPRLRKLALTAHITSSVGWLGAVAAFLALAIAGLTGQDAQRVRAAYLAMELIGWSVIVPACFASLSTGLVMSLGTPWGLFRHYWVLAKLVIAALATLLLLVHMQPIEQVASVAATSTLSSADLQGVRVQLVGDAVAALLALLVATGLSVWKPRGVTPYGRAHGGAADEGAGSTASAPRWVHVSGSVVLILVLLFVIKHLLVGHTGH